ncbi:MAG: protein kinase domain-containing protein [Oceanococcus sp.]
MDDVQQLAYSPLNSFATLEPVANDELAACGSEMETQGSESEAVRWRFANAEYNERNHELMVDGAAVALEPKPMDVLRCLLRAEGELVTKEELFESVWAGRVVTDGVLSQSIRRIREVLGDTDRSMLRTVHGYGFRLDVPIEIEGRERPGTRLQLEAGQSLPNLPHWILEQRLQTRPANELWRIRHAQSGQQRVLKLALDQRAQQALKREVTLNKVLRAELGDKAPLVPLLEWHFETTPAWIQMPWYEQGSLNDWLNAQGGPNALDLSRRLAIVAEAADALAQAHALGVMHKDIKPGNFLLTDSGEGTRLLLCDFGSGTVKSRDRLDQAGVTVMGFTQTIHADASTSGTPAYMAPEVLKGGVFSEKSDIYALGILLYQLSIGDLNEPMAAGWEEDVSDPSLRAIIAQACAGKPARRIASMQELAKRIRAWQPSAKPSSGADTQQGKAPAYPRQQLRYALFSLLVVLAALWLWRNVEVVVNPSDKHVVAPPPALDQRVAILDFEFLGLDKQTQTVMGGLQDALIADLANLADIRLVHGQNLAALNLVDAPAPQIGRALNADQLIRGSVQQLGEQLRFNLQIIDATHGETIWGQVIQGTRTNLFAVQADIGQALAVALGTHLSPATTQAVSNEAYEAYLAALSIWNQGYDGKEKELASELDRALALAPNFIDAHLLALLKAARDYWFSFTTRAISEARISEHLSALERLDTPPVKLATARAMRRYYLDHNPSGGLEILAPFRRHLLGNAESALLYAYMLRRVGRIDEAFAILDQVIAQNPSAFLPVEAKAELLAFLGRGGEAVALLQKSASRFGSQSHIPIKIATFGYQLTGEIGYVQFARQALENSAAYSGMLYYADLEIARRQQDWQRVRELARSHAGDDKTDSGHGRVPKEISTVLALRAGQAPAAEIRTLATSALEKIQRWREESDSPARQSTMALALALLGRTEEALALSSQVEAAFPLERDQLEGADHLMRSATIHVLAGDEQGVLHRLEKVSATRFSSFSLCSVPYSMQHQLLWELEIARDFISTHCEPIWTQNRGELAPVLNELIKATT